jgi:NCS1 nucleoside transporter family
MAEIKDGIESTLGHEYGAEKVPPSARNYGFFDTFFLWFGGGVNTGSWWMGGVMATFGLSLALTYSWILIPFIFFPWALLGYIAYKHGLTTSAMTRASLGSRGAGIQSLFQAFVMAGWCSVNTFIGAISVTFIFHIMWGWPAFGSEGAAMPMIFGILIIGILQGIFAVSGHNIIKYMEWVSGLLLIGLGLYMTYVVIDTFSWTALMSWENNEAPYATFGILIDILIGFCWSWTHIGDFGRFAKTKKAAVLAPWFGVNIGQGWFFVIGAIGVIGVALQTGSIDLLASDPSTIMSELGLGWMAFAIIIFCTVNTNAMNIYTSSMGLINLFNNNIKSRTSLLIIAVLQLVLCFVPLLFPSFLDFFSAFLTASGGLFAPFWTLVLVDYFIIRRQRLFDDIFDVSPQSSHWHSGGFNRAGIVSLLAGASTFYFFTYAVPNVSQIISATGPSIIVTSGLYILLVKAGITSISDKPVPPEMPLQKTNEIT